MSTSAPSPAGSRVYHIVLFSFAGAKRAGDVLQEINAAQKLADVKIVAEAWVERDPRGNVHVHEAGRGGMGATAGVIAGGVLGLLGGLLRCPCWPSPVASSGAWPASWPGGPSRRRTWCAWGTPCPRTAPAWWCWRR